MDSFILNFFCEIIVFICGLASVALIYSGEEISELQLYLWIFTCLIYVIVSSINRYELMVRFDSMEKQIKDKESSK